MGDHARALCCHHACRWRPYVGRPFLEAHGVDAEDFAYLCRLSSWGCCGWRDADAAAADPVCRSSGNHAFVSADHNSVTPSAVLIFPLKGWTPLKVTRFFGVPCRERNF